MNISFPQHLYRESVFSELLMDYYCDHKHYILTHRNEYIKSAFQEIVHNDSILKEQIGWYKRIWEAYREPMIFDTSDMYDAPNMHMNLYNNVPITYSSVSNFDIFSIPADINDILYKLQIFPIGKYHNLSDYYNWTDEEIMDRVFHQKLIDEFFDIKSKIEQLRNEFRVLLDYAINCDRFVCYGDLNSHWFGYYVDRYFNKYRYISSVLNKYILMPSFVDAVINNTKFVLVTDIYSFTHHVRYTYHNYDFLRNHIELTHSEEEFVKQYTIQSLNDGYMNFAYDDYNSRFDRIFETFLCSKIAMFIDLYATPNTVHGNIPEDYSSQIHLYTQYLNTQIGA